MVGVAYYSFNKSFRVSARRAFEWCTNYSLDDMKLMQEENATRGVQYISDTIIILTDTYVVKEKSIVKQKLVCLYPDRLTWTSTHLTGPNRYSQFLYEVTSQAEQQSCLKFTGLYIDYKVKNEDGGLTELSEELKKMDLENWKNLAKEMEKELKQGLAV